MMRVAGRDGEGKAKAVLSDTDGALVTNDNTGVLKKGVNIVVPANSSVRVVDHYDTLFDRVGSIDFGIEFVEAFENSVKIDHYIVDDVGTVITKNSDYKLPPLKRLRGEFDSKIFGNRVRITVYNHTSTDKNIKGYFVKGKNSQENTQSSKIEKAYDNSSRSVRAIIQNSVEVEQPDAFQMSEIILKDERLENDSSLLYFSRTPPRGAKGFIATLHVGETNNTLADGQGINLKINGSVADPSLTSFHMTTGKINSSGQKFSVFWDQHSSTEGLAQDSNIKSMAISLPLPKYLTFVIERDTLNQAEYLDITLELGWI